MPQERDAVMSSTDVMGPTKAPDTMPDPIWGRVTRRKGDRDIVEYGRLTAVVYRALERQAQAAGSDLRMIPSSFASDQAACVPLNTCAGMTMPVPVRSRRTRSGAVPDLMKSTAFWRPGGGVALNCRS
jgi:hypothetical protein